MRGRFLREEQKRDAEVLDDGRSLYDEEGASVPLELCHQNRFKVAHAWSVIRSLLAKINLFMSSSLVLQFFHDDCERQDQNSSRKFGILFDNVEAGLQTFVNNWNREFTQYHGPINDPISSQRTHTPVPAAAAPPPPPVPQPSRAPSIPQQLYAAAAATPPPPPTPAIPQQVSTPYQDQRVHVDDVMDTDEQPARAWLPAKIYQLQQCAFYASAVAAVPCQPNVKSKNIPG